MGDLYAKKLPVFMLGWAPDYSDADDYANPFCELNGTYASVLGIQNTTMSVLVDKAAADVNETQRASMYSQIQNISYQNAYYIWTDQATNYHVERILDIWIRLQPDVWRSVLLHLHEECIVCWHEADKALQTLYIIILFRLSSIRAISQAFPHIHRFDQAVTRPIVPMFGHYSYSLPL